MSLRQHKSILLVDDDPITNMIHTKIIEKCFDTSFIVTAFTNPYEALHQLREWSASGNDDFPGILFLDINMPHLDGWEFLEEYQKLPAAVLEKCRVIMLSSSIDRHDIEKSKTYKVVRQFVSKPLTPDMLETLLTA